jgi:hypothetical protein
MKMIKSVVILALLMTLTLCVFNIATASSMSTSQPRSGSSTYHFEKFIPGPEQYPNHYPPQVQVTENFNVFGTLMKGNTPVTPVGLYGPDSLYHGEIIANVPNPQMWKVRITSANGTFKDTFNFGEQGRHDIIYTYIYGPGLADFCVSDVITIYAVKTA